MTELLDLLFGLLSPNLFRWDYSKALLKAEILEGPEKERIIDLFQKHMQLDPATACIDYDSIFVKPIGKRHIQMVALKNKKKVFKYLSKGEFDFRQKGKYVVICE